mgnify:CR=1 FL=1
MQKSILLKAPLLTRSGYGEQARFALRALKSREDLFDITGGRTVPQVVINDDTIGGYDDLVRFDQQGKL